MNEPNDLDDLYGSDTDDLYGGDLPDITTNRQRQRRTDIATEIPRMLSLFMMGTMVRPFIANPAEFRSAITKAEDLYADTQTPAEPTDRQRRAEDIIKRMRGSRFFNSPITPIIPRTDFNVNKQVHSQQDKQLMAATRAVLECYIAMLYLILSRLTEHAGNLPRPK